jgi:hypothetical protein
MGPFVEYPIAILKKWTYIALLALLACEPEEPVREVIVTATLRAGTTPLVYLYYADDLSPVTDASLRLKTNDQWRNMTWNGQGYEQLNHVLAPNDTIYLTCDLDGYTALAHTRIPPAIEVTSVSSTQITINPNSTGSPAMVVQWTALPANQYSYLLQLESLDPSPVAIPFIGPGGLFDVQYSGPISQTGTILFDTDFANYGEHRLTIYAIRKDFENLFFYDKTDLRGLVLLSPDNIENAKGFVAAVSSTSIDFVTQ